MALIDIVLLVIIGAFVFFGLFFGFVHTLGALAGTVLGIIIASRFSDPIFDAVGFILGGGSFARIAIFIVVFLIVSRLAGFAFWIIEKTLKIFSFIPFSGLVNRIAGVVLGFFEGIVVVSVTLFYVTKVLPQDTFISVFESSVVSDYLLAIANVLRIFLPNT
jgi:uncharacterized membrane protein required for colicin V production